MICLGMGCGKEELYTSWGKSNDTSLTDSLSIKIRQAAVAENGDKLTFVKLLEDSRCPANAMCIWQGMVSVELKAETSAGDTTFILSTDPNTPGAQTAIVLGYEVSLVNVLPYPGTYEEIKPADFWVELVVKSTGE